MTEEKEVNQKEIHQDQEDPHNLLNGIYYTGDKGPRFGTRHTQFMLMTLGMGLSVVTKTCFSIIYVAMTEQTSSNPDVPIYDWKNQGVILGAILWSGIPTQILGGYLGRIWGYKWLTLGLSLVNAIFFMLIPLSANTWGSTGVVVCRFIQGAAQGALAPMGAILNGHWIPAEEWSMVGVVGLGATIVLAVVSTVSVGFIAASWLGWAWCFYYLGIIELVWCGFWLFFSHETPHEHPKITPEEKMYIQVSLKQREQEVVLKTPWKKILTSMPFYAVVVATVGTDWTATIQTTVIASFLAKVLGIKAESSGTIMGIGPFIGIIFGFITAKTSDFIIRRNIVRRVNARRLFHTVGSFGMGLNLFWLTFLTPGSTAMVILNMCLGNVFMMFYSVAGSGVNILDISPVFAGFIVGTANTFSHAISLFAPLSVDWIVKNQESASEWRIVMLITAGFAILTAIFFDIFATDKRQEDWEENSDQTNDSNKN